MNSYPLLTELYTTWQIAKMAELRSSRHSRIVLEWLIRIYILANPRCIWRTKKAFNMSWWKAWRHTLYQWSLRIAMPKYQRDDDESLLDQHDPYEYYGD